MMEKIIAMLKKMGEDVDYDIWDFDDELPELVITVNDFEGFDHNWSEIMRDYDVKAVCALICWLREHCISKDEDMYYEYQFEGFKVQLGYSSYNI